MRKLAYVLLFVLYGCFTFTSAHAGPGHDHGHSHEPINLNQAEQQAMMHVTRLVGKGKLDKSWQSLKAWKVEKKKYQHGSEWMVIFNNEKVTDASKRTLYVFLTLTGDYLAANFTGN